MVNFVCLLLQLHSIMGLFLLHVSGHSEGHQLISLVTPQLSDNSLYALHLSM